MIDYFACIALLAFIIWCLRRMFREAGIRPWHRPARRQHCPGREVDGWPLDPDEQEKFDALTKALEGKSS